MTEEKNNVNPLASRMAYCPLACAKDGLRDLKENWIKHGVEPYPIPYQIKDPELPGRDWLPEPDWMSGYDAFQLFQLQTEPYNVPRTLARICTVISDQADRNSHGLNYAICRVPPSHELLEQFTPGSNQWFRALHLLLTLWGAKEIDGFDTLVSDLHDWLNFHDSLRLRSYDVVTNAIDLDWQWHELSLPEAKQDPIWSFPKAMAWIATRDYLALARIGSFRQAEDDDEAVADEGVCCHNTAALGWLHTAISYAHCACGALQDYRIRSYQHCTCISVAWEELVHFNGGLSMETPELVFGMQEGWLSMTWPEGANNLRFLRRDILDRWPALKSDTAEKATVLQAKVGAETECRDWLRSAFDADPEKVRTKSSFQNEALSRFSTRLSVRGFLRAWDSVAVISGRSSPGRKS